jgi:hypothetical protein
MAYRTVLGWTGRLRDHSNIARPTSFPGSSAAVKISQVFYPTVWSMTSAAQVSAGTI